MTKPKRHHYLPESYQKGFWDEQAKKICFIDLQTGTRAATAPRNVGVEKHLYRFDTPVEGVSDTAIENPLLSTLDHRYVTALRKIEGDFNDDDRQSLAIALAFLRFRTPLMFRDVEMRAIDFFLAEIKKNPGKVAQAAAIGVNLDDPAAFMDSTSEIFQVPKDLVLSVFLKSSVDFAFALVAMGWRVYTTDTGKFITSDKPFSAVEGPGLFSSNGVRGSYLIPLSSRLCLEIGACEQPLEFVPLSLDQVREINGIVAYCADKKIFGSHFEELDLALASSELDTPTPKQ
ncbi:DUF4238 domain-containing protein (plasmid) [Pseudomonas fragi]|uniref:DUF4238 domain-containing protein n=1 Tax=Pseudomonas fragi TaxID=296 RepID=UPI0021C15075|nr:DUF4238 domain-containing protein [Pseudomonas fragi]UXL41060.1 DUF4238 domain-containing protein [Pseudomonas fragi]